MTMKTKLDQIHADDPIDALITIAQEEAVEILGEDWRESEENGIFDSYPGDLIWDGETHRRVDEKGRT